jgi:hypothetical protein
VAVSARERRFLLNHLTRQAASDVAALWRSAQQFAEQDFVGFIVDGYPQIVDGWNAVAAELAAVWFEQSVPGAAVTADPLPVDRLESSARWAVYGGEPAGGLGRLQQTTQRSVYDGARQTTLVNAQRTGTRWARDAQADACAFCRMLATRTGRNLYSSRDTAATEVHNDCHCVPVEVPNPKAYQLPDHAQQWQDEYRKARAEAGTTDMTQVLSAWRELSGIH